MAFSRTQHHPVLAKGDRLLVLIGRDVPDGKNRHGRPMIRPWIACIFRAKSKGGEANDDAFLNKSDRR